MWALMPAAMKMPSRHWREEGTLPVTEPKVNHYRTQITSLLHAIKDEIKSFRCCHTLLPKIPPGREMISASALGNLAGPIGHAMKKRENQSSP